MATWHQMKGQRRARKAGRPINFQHETGWTVVIDPPNEMRSAITFSDKAEAERYQKKFEHTYIIPPANKLTRNPRRKRIASRLVTRAKLKKRAKKRRTTKCARQPENGRRLVKPKRVETVRRNPAKRYMLEALAMFKGVPRYFYWNDAGQRFTTERTKASPYSSEAAAKTEAKKLLPRVPKTVIALRVVPA